MPTSPKTATGDANRFWSWHPPLPLEPVPVFVRPVSLRGALGYLASLTFFGSILLPFFATAAIAWFWLTPALERFEFFEITWAAQLWIRNAVLMLAVAGGLHLYFYVFKVQGNTRRFDDRDIRINKRFFGNRQIIDNMSWTLGSGVTFWTIYEGVMFWGFANGHVPMFLNWMEHPIWFFVMFIIIPFFTSMHFYFVHRLLHWPPIYRIAHAPHHRNDNLGPWSGLSMHPLEHLIYLSSVLIHAVVLSHPLHILFHLHWNTLGAATSHTGFESIVIKNRRVFTLGSFHHQLHHRFVNCNFGNPFMPWDRWLGTDHDGSDEATAHMRKRLRAKVRTN